MMNLTLRDDKVCVQMPARLQYAGSSCITLNAHNLDYPTIYRSCRNTCTNDNAQGLP
jgi:hypothetical protein